MRDQVVVVTLAHELLDLVVCLSYRVELLPARKHTALKLHPLSENRV